MAGPVHLHHGSHRAIEGAVEGLERHVGAGDGAQRCQQLDTAAHPAGHAGAHTNQPRAGFRQPELRVVRGDAVRLGSGHAEMRGDLGQRGGRDPAQLGQEPRAFLGEGVEDAAPVAHVRRSMRGGYGVDQMRLREALLAQETRVAEPAGAAVRFGRVAGPGQGEIHAELVGAGNDLSLAEGDERRVNAKVAATFDPRLRGEIGETLESLDELRTAVGIARVVEGVDPDEDVLRPLYLRPPQGMGEEDGVPRRDVGDRDARADRLLAPPLGNVDVRREGGAADGAEVETQDQMRLGAEGRRHLLRRLELPHVALAIVERQGGALVALGAGDGEGSRGIEAAREQHDSARRHYTPRRAPHSTIWRRGEKRKPWRVHISTTRAPRSISSSRRIASGWRRMRLLGRAKRSARLSTSATSRSSVTTNFHHASRDRKSLMTAGRTRVASATPEAPSFNDTFHWIDESRPAGGVRVPEVSTSMAKPERARAWRSGANSGDSRGSPPVTTTRSHG